MLDADGQRTGQSKAEQVEENGGCIVLPEQTAPYLLAYLQRMGFHGFGAMGPVPLSALEIRAWCDGAGVVLQHWEFEALLGASRAYINARLGPDDSLPYGDPEDLADPDVVDARLEAIFSRLARPINRRKD